MSSYVAKEEVEPLTAGGTDSVILKVPTTSKIWSVHVFPIDSGGADDPTVTILFWVNGQFVATNPAITAVAPSNQDTVFTRDDAVSKIRVDLANGATPPDGGAVIELHAFHD